MNIFKIKYTAQELEALLNSIDSKLTLDDVSNDFEGGTKKLASAELAKILNTKFESLSNPDTFKGLYLNIPGSAIFTITDKTKLGTLDLSSFKGVFTNSSLRADALPPSITNNYAGKEISFLLDNGLGQQSWDYWDSLTHTWKPSKVAAAGTVDSLTVASVGTVVYTTLDKTKYQTCKITLQATKTTQYQSMELLVGTNGTDTYITSYAELGNASLIDVAAVVNGNFMDIQVTTLASNVVLKARKTAEI